MRKRVIYIDDSACKNPDYNGPSPVFMESYHVVKEFMYKGIWSYILEEFGYGFAFTASRFSPTTDATATELFEQEFEAIIK